MNKFRTLRADEIDCRVSQAKDKGVTLLLYKDARCDQNILDETVGPMNWQRFHSRDNANCTVQIWDIDKMQWVGKEDVGTPSNTEADKGLASDSFKRACFNWGIGRELYSAPFVYIPAGKCNITEGRNGKPTCLDHFSVREIGYQPDGARDICKLVIANDKTGEIVYNWTDKQTKPVQEETTPNEKPSFPNEIDDVKAAEQGARNTKRLKELGSKTGLSGANLKDWKNMAVDNKIIPDRKWAEYNDTEMSNFIRFVEANVNVGIS